MGLGRDDRGAAAVEFALVVPVLLVLVFAIIDYGLFFNDSMAARQGAREAARRGVVEDFTSGSCTGKTASGNIQMQMLACLALDRGSGAGGHSYARVFVSDAAGGGSTSWQTGRDVVACVLVDDISITGLTPLPDDAQVRAQVRMRIERSDTPPTGAALEGFARRDGAPPPPLDAWSGWCG